MSPTVHVHHSSPHRSFLVISPPESTAPGQAAADGYALVGEELHRNNLTIVQERIFGSLSVQATVMAARREALQSRIAQTEGPVTYIQGRPIGGEGYAGTIIHAVPAAGTSGLVSAVLDEGRPCGRIWHAGDLTYIILQNLHGVAARTGDDNKPGSQSRRMIERAERILRRHGAAYGDTVRTWFYLSDILSWYDEFNRVRNTKYGEFGLMPDTGDGHLLPASTGIRANLPGKAACALDLLAVVAVDNAAPCVERLSNPRQQDAFRYGSAFSRSAVVHNAHDDLIEVSGTAAIDEHGRSLYAGDIRSQIHCTLDKVAALLERSHASLEDIQAATVFIKSGKDAEITRQVVAERGLDRLPAVYVVADVCRDELLFEIDAEAVIRGR